MRACGAGQIAVAVRLSSLLRAKREPEKHQRFRRAGSTRKGLLAPFRPRRSCRSTKMLAASLNAFLYFSGLRLRRWCYAFAELYVLQGRKVCCEAANGRNEKKVQQRRPPPAADTGRSCWGRGQQDTSAAQGTKWTLGTATRLSAAASFFPFRLLLWNC